MQLGLHFGKRKPRWNFFIHQQRNFRQRYQLAIKFVCLTVIMQMIVLAPLAYWSIQNYNFFEKNLPYSLAHYVNTEKTWLVILFIITVLLTGFINFKFYAKVFDDSKPQKDTTNDNVILPSGAANRYHAS